MESNSNQQAIWMVGSSCQAPSILGVKKGKVYKVTFDFSSYIPGDFLHPDFSEVDLNILQAIVHGNNPAIKLVASSGNIIHELFKLCNWFVRYGIAEGYMFSHKQKKSINYFRNMSRLMSKTRSLFDIVIDLGLI